MHLPFDLGLRKVKAMDKAIKRYFPVFALPTLAAFTIGFILPFALGVYLSLLRVYHSNRRKIRRV